MRIVKGRGDLPQYGKLRLRGRQGIALNPTPEVEAGREIHHEVVVARLFIFLKRARSSDVLVVQVADNLVIGADFLHLVFVAAHLRRKPLHCHFHAAELVETLIDNSHPAFAKF